MEARAGTGKTFALEAVREAYEGSRIPVIGVAWQGQAADVLQRDAGIPSQTAALLLDRIARGDGRGDSRRRGDRLRRGLDDADARARAARERGGSALRPA